MNHEKSRGALSPGKKEEIPPQPAVMGYPIPASLSSLEMPKSGPGFLNSMGSDVDRMELYLPVYTTLQPLSGRQASPPLRKLWFCCGLL